jgi:transposase
MLPIIRRGRLFLALRPTDMRRGIDSLSSQVLQEMGEDPYRGDCFLFLGRDRRRLKVLVWEDGGFWLCLKRLVQGTFPVPAGWGATAGESAAGAKVDMSESQITAMLEGIEVQEIRRRKRFRRQ